MPPARSSHVRLPLIGGCACGAVRYQITAPPLTVYICHCHDCQVRTGSAFSLGMPVERSAFALTAAPTETLERVGASGRVSRQHFCGRCLARTHSETEINLRTVTVRPGTLDDTSWVRPVAQMWSGSAQPWAVRPAILTYADEATNDPLAPVRAFAALDLFDRD